MIKLINQQPCVRNLYSHIVTSTDGSTGEYTISITETLFGYVVGEALYFNGEIIPRKDWNETENKLVEEANFLSGEGNRPEWADKLQKEMAEDVERRVEKFLVGIHN
jgi:hypothetical protein